MSSIVDVSELRWAVKPDLLANNELLIERSQQLGLDFTSQVLPQIKNVLKYDLKPITIFSYQLSRTFPLISYDMASVITWEMIKKSFHVCEKSFFTDETLNFPKSLLGWASHRWSIATVFANKKELYWHN